MHTFFIQARHFQLAAERCMEERQLPNNQFQWLPIPYVVNAAFACELYLKGILEKNDVKIPAKHDLKCLYNLLPYNIRKIIKHTFEDKNMIFENELKMAKDLFLKWRYIHEDILKGNEISANLAFIRLFLDILSKTSKQL